jgi:acyl carrier protein
MKNSTTLARVIEAIREHMQTQYLTDYHRDKLDNILPEDQFVDLGFDSLDYVELGMALEKAFQLQGELSLFVQEHCTTVQQLVDYVDESLKEGVWKHLTW